MLRSIGGGDGCIDPLTLDQMRVLVAVAETGSFSAAARKLGRVQSAISQAVQTMEQALRLTLFDRAGKTPMLTDAGAAMLARRARGAGARAGDAGARARHPRRPRTGTDAGGRGDVSHAAADEQPGGAARRLPDPAGDAVHRGARRRAGDADDRRGAHGDLSRSWAAPPADVHAEFLARVALAPVAAADHPLARLGRPARREDLEAHVQLVLTGRNAYAQSLRGGVVSPHLWRFVDQTVRLEFLLSGFGWCNMPLHMVEEHIDAGPPAPARNPARRAAAGIPALCRLPARPPARARRPLAGRRPAPAAEILPDFVPARAGGGVRPGTLSRSLRSHSPTGA